MAELSQDQIQRPGVARDPGVSMQPRASLLSRVEDPRGSALTQYHNDLNAVSNTFKQLYETRQSAEDKSYADAFHLEYSKRVGPIEQEMINSPEASKPEFVSKLMGRLDDEHKATAEYLTANGVYAPGRKGQEAADHVAMQLRIAAAKRATVEVHRQRVTGIVDNTNDEVLEYARQAGARGNVDEGIANVDRALSKTQNIIAPDKYRALQRAGRDQVVESVARGYIERGDYNTARGMLDRSRGFAAGTPEREIADVANEYGVDPSYLVSVARNESSMNNGARPQIDPATGKPVTSARGLFGFVEKTGVEHGLPADASQASTRDQAVAAAKLTASNRKVLASALGQEPTNSQLYLAHFLGASDAAKVLTANPNVPVQNLINEKSFRANEKLLTGKTAGDMADWSASKTLGAGGGGASHFMEEKSRIQLLNLVETRQHTMAERQRQEVERIRTAIKDDAMRDIFTRIELGDTEQNRDPKNKAKTTNEVIQDYRHYMSASEYNTALSLANGEESIKDDAHARIDLSTTAGTTIPTEYEQKVRTYVDERKIKPSTAAAYISQNRTLRKDDAPKDVYTEELNWLRGQLKPVNINAVTAQMQMSGALNAEREYNDYARQNPKATPEELREKSTDLVRRTRLLDNDNMKLSVVMSPYFDAKTKSQVTLDHVSQAERKMRKDFEDKKLSRQQLDYEIDRLNNWRNILENEARMKQEAAEAAAKKNRR